MDIRKIISETNLYNFHTHTQFCDGHDTIDAMAAAAVNAGILHLGFSPHSPIPIESPCNMAIADVDNYRQAIARVREHYNNICHIYMGMEVDFLGPEYGPHSPRIKALGLDYTIGSVHFIRSQEGVYVDIDGRFESFKRKMHGWLHDDIRYVVEEFFRSSHTMLSLGGFDILGHFDKIAQNASYFSPGIEDTPWYCALIDDFIDHVVSSGVIVEINTKAYLEHGRFFPSTRHWDRLVSAGVCMLVNSDAHYAERITASRADAIIQLKNICHAC